jgi:tRNA C32,U32 (ribose-2'-O)-methylase TrmJ
MGAMMELQREYDTLKKQAKQIQNRRYAGTPEQAQAEQMRQLQAIMERAAQVQQELQKLGEVLEGANQRPQQ